MKGAGMKRKGLLQKSMPAHDAGKSIRSVGNQRYVTVADTVIGAPGTRLAAIGTMGIEALMVKQRCQHDASPSGAVACVTLWPSMNCATDDTDCDVCVTVHCK